MCLSCSNYENLDIGRTTGCEVNRIADTKEGNYCESLLRNKSKIYCYANLNDEMCNEIAKRGSGFNFLGLLLLKFTRELKI